MVINDDGGDAETIPFLTLFTSLKDFPEKAFLESISAIYRKRPVSTAGSRRYADDKCRHAREIIEFCVLNESRRHRAVVVCVDQHANADNDEQWSNNACQKN